MTADNREQTTEGAGRSRGAGRRRSYSFRNLLVWQRAQDLTVAILELMKTLPTDRSTNVLTQQLLRAASSIGANIAEGHGRFAAGAYRNHLSIARGSANETIGWLDVLARAGYVDQSQIDELTGRCDEILRMISAQMIQLDQQTGKGKGFREERAEYVVE